MIGGEARLEHTHAGIEVKGRWLTQLSSPLHLVRALLAVANLVLRRVTPRLLTKAVHHCVEMAVGQIKQVVYVIIHLYVSVQVYHLTVLYELHADKNITFTK